MSSNDDEFTDIRNLPDLGEQEDDFESLESMAQDMGLSTEEDAPTEPLKEDFNFEEEESSFSSSFEEEAEEEDTEDSLPDMPDDSFGEKLESEAEIETELEEEFQNDFGDDDEVSFEDSSDFEEDQEEQDEEDNDFSIETPVFDSVDDLVEEEVTASKKTPIKKEDLHEPISSPTNNIAEEFKEISQESSFANFSSEGNPPFNIILKDLKYYEDIDDITEILIELKILKEADLETAKNALTRGQYLIPRLSEFAGITLCHKLRKFDLDITMGLTAELNPAKSYQSNDKGPISKRSILANKAHHLELNKDFKKSDILTTTLPQLFGYQIEKYLGVASQSMQVDQSIFKNNHALEGEISEHMEGDLHQKIETIRTQHENIKASESKRDYDYETIYMNKKEPEKALGLEHIYSKLITELKDQAQHAHANAVVGINFSITPIAIGNFIETGPQYQVVCTGNLVWIKKD